AARISLVRDIFEHLLATGCKSAAVDCSKLVLNGNSDAFVEVLALPVSRGMKVRLLSPPQSLDSALASAGLLERITFEDAVSPKIEWKSCSFAAPARASALAGIRNKVSLLAAAMPFSTRQIEDIRLAVGEAATNAVKYGPTQGSMVLVRCFRHDDRFVVDICDAGCGFDPEAEICREPDALREGSRGLYFIELLMDEVDFRFACGTTVRLVKKL
ncbi:MAG: ATP-binding protein, partial [Armatimonadota bacterium]